MKVSVHDQLPSKPILEQFLAIPPRTANGFILSRRQIEGRPYPRETLSRILYDFNLSLGNDIVALANARRLGEPGSYCVVTGQQLGLMGGPALTFLKAISCLLLARETGAIPIFWAATDDHDISEINHAYQVDAYGNLARYQLNWPQNAASVEDLVLLPQHIEVMRAFWHALGPFEPSMPLPKPGERYADVMLRILIETFAGTGLLFLEPRLLRPLTRPIFQEEIAACDEFAAILRDTTKRLWNAGGHAPINVSAGPNLFYKDANGHRTKVHREGNAFRIHQQIFTESDLLNEVEDYPERFSPSAALRPIVQNALMPVLAYVAGPTELAYHSQLLGYHQAHNVPMTWVVPRVSATFITPLARRILDIIGMTPWQRLPTTWNQLMPDFEGLGEQLAEEVQQQVEVHFGSDVHVDATIEEFARHVIDRAIQKRLDSLGLPHHALHLLHNMLSPQERRQERVLSWWTFQATSRSSLVQEVLSCAKWQEIGHYYLDIEP